MPGNTTKRLDRSAAILRLEQQGSDPSGEAATSCIYAKDVNGATELFIKSDTGTVHQVTPVIHQKTSAPTVNDDVTFGYMIGSHWADTTADKAYICLDATDGAAVWIETTAGAAGGETNTASNVGTSGVGVFKQKTGVDLEFKKINNGEGVKITDDTGNNEVDIELDVNTLTADASPDGAADYVATWDASAGAHKKVLLDDLPGGSAAVEKTLTADQLLSPNNADWKVNALAPLAADSNNAAISCRLFDDTIEEGVGFMVMVPTGMTSMTVKLKHRAETGVAGNKKVAPKLYNRGLPDDAAVQAWSAGNTFADLVFPNNENWQYDEETLTLATMGVTAGEMTQFQMTRVAAAGSALAGDWTLQSIGLEFT